MLSDPLARHAVSYTREQARAPLHAALDIHPGPRSAPRLALCYVCGGESAAPRRRAAAILTRLTALLFRPIEIPGSYHDPLFVDPERVENDYFRLRNQPTRAGGEQVDPVSIDPAGLEPKGYDAAVYEEMAAVARDGLALLQDASGPAGHPGRGRGPTRLPGREDARATR
jgi:hypothetical protein